MKRYLRLLWIQLKASSLLALQYRGDFLLDAIVSIFWSATSIVPLTVVFNDRTMVAGWRYPEALVVFGWFMVLEAILEGAVNPSLIAVVDHIRKGTLDFVLIKPADAQFLVSTSRFLPWSGLNIVVAGVIFVVAFDMLDRMPTLAGIMQCITLLGCATLFLYSLWILVVCLAFYVVRIDNLSYLFTSIIDAARWPIDVFRGTLRWIFTFVFPLALMTTYPARALLGTLRIDQLIFAVLFCTAFATLARAMWKRSLAHYSSASS